MSDEGKKRWLIKDKEGHVRGPYLTDDILGRISRGEFSGEEKIALYPGSDWISISQEPQFYDELLNILYDSSEPLDVQKDSKKIISLNDVDDDRPEGFIEKKSKVCPDYSIQKSTSG